MAAAWCLIREMSGPASHAAATLRLHGAALWAVGVCAAALGLLRCDGGASSTRITPPPETVRTAAVPRRADTVASGASSAVAPGAAAAPRASTPASAEAFRHPAPGRLIAIGDVHGDLAATLAALRLGGAIDEAARWVGGNLTVVQTGDQLDRGDDEPEIVDLFERLTKDARVSGGQVVALNGNHEVMNAQGDFRYVTPEGLADFGGVSPRSQHADAAPPEAKDRAAAFLPGGAYALKLAQRDVIAVVGDSVFVHGGILPDHLGYGIDRINRETRDWMQSGGRVAPAGVASSTGPVWVRDYSLDPVSENTCASLASVLDALGVARMVVGHTPQKNGITSACGERVYRIDVGLARYYGEGPIQVLEIADGVVRTLSAAR